MFKILDKQGGEVTASQQAVFNKISTNNADGYVDGFLNNLNMAVMSSNMISIDSGLLSIQGFRSVNDTLAIYTVSVTPSEPIPFQLVAAYSHFVSDENDTLEITTRPVQELRREPLFSGQNAVYEVELAEFTMTADGITDFKATLEKIVYNEQDISELMDKVTKAEKDSAYARELVEELKTQIIEKQGTAVYVGGTAQNRVDFTSDPQTQLDGKQPVGDYATKEELESIDTQEIIYDKDSGDSAINLGYPNGILAGAEAITSINFSKYKYVIVECLMSTRATVQCYIGKLQTAVSLSGGYIGFMTIDINTQYLKVTSAKEIYLYGTNQISWYEKENVYNVTKITGVLKYEDSNTQQ